jgi:L-glyceraldehyde 3-phosphate reductase
MLKRRQIKGLGGDTSALSLGSWRTFEAMEFEDILSVLEACFALGVNFLDDCRYGQKPGVPAGIPTTEVTVGRALKVLGIERSAFTIATKLWWDQVPEHGLDGQLARAMTRLDLDHIDLVYIDRPDKFAEANPGVPFDWDETAALAIEVMNGLIDRSVIGAYGLANATPEAVERIANIAAKSGSRPPAVAQLRFNMAEPDAGLSSGLIAAHAKDGTTVAATMPLAGGVLTGKYLSVQSEPHRWTEEFAATLKTPLSVSALLLQLSAQLNIPPSALAMAYPLSFNHVSTVVFGARNAQQVKENVTSVAEAAKPEICEMLAEIVANPEPKSR